MGGSASQNLQAMAPLGLMQYTVAIATPRLCPDHRTTSTDQVRGGQENLSCCFCPPVPCFTSFSCLLQFLPWDHEQGWCSLRLYPLKTKTAVPLPLYVTLYSLTIKVRTLTPSHPFVLSCFCCTALSTNFAPIVLMAVLQLSLYELNIKLRDSFLNTIILHCLSLVLFFYYLICFAFCCIFNKFCLVNAN